MWVCGSRWGVGVGVWVRVGCGCGCVGLGGVWVWVCGSRWGVGVDGVWVVTCVLCEISQVSNDVKLPHMCVCTYVNHPTVLAQLADWLVQCDVTPGPVTLC